MNNIIGVIHAKGSSERIIRKNFCLLDRTPLYLCQALNLETLIGKENVYVDTECDEIEKLSQMNGFKVFKRNKKLASNLTGGVKLLKNFLENVKTDAKVVVQLFPPMPILDLISLKKGINNVLSGKFDSAHFRYNKQLYQWKNKNPSYKFNGSEIPNSTTLPSLELEFPTVYVVKIDKFLEQESRIPDKLFKMTPSSAFYEIDIDDDIDFSITNQIYNLPYVKKQFDFFYRIRTYFPPIIFWDVDGTLTNGAYNASLEEEIFKSFNTLDGIAIKELNDLGIINCIVTSSNSDKIIKHRNSILNCYLLLSIKNKLDACTKFSEENGFNLRECFFVGNDVNDLEVMSKAGRSFCPLDANEEIKKFSETLLINGGEGIARTLINKLKSEKYIRRNHD